MAKKGKIAMKWGGFDLKCGEMSYKNDIFLCGTAGVVCSGRVAVMVGARLRHAR